jgi:hypothetical protein
VDTSARWDERDLFDSLVVVVQDLLRQTGGFSEVASRGAVLDGDVAFVGHENSLLLLMTAR